MLASERSSPPNQIGRPRTRFADHDPVFVALRTEISSMPIAVGAGVPALANWAAHVLLVQRLHGMPIQLQLLGNIPDWRAAAAAADVKSKPLGVERVVRQELQTLALHLAALAAPDAPYLELQEYAQAAGRKISSAANRAIVPPAMVSSARP